MSRPELDGLLAPPGSREPLDRRGFLVRLGLLAGVGALAGLGLSRNSKRVRRFETARPALGTAVRISVCCEEPDRASRGAAAAFAAIARVDAQMSIHRRDSQVARVNAAAGKHMVPCDPAVLDVVERALSASRRTGGLFDPTILPLMRLYGFYDSRRDRWPSDREIADVLDRTGHRHVRIDRAGGRLGLARRGAALDLGAIGKGWALDRAVDALRAEGIESALVDVGGNVYGLGAPDGQEEGWSVGVLHPVKGTIDRTFLLRNRAVATSGNSEQNHLLGRRRVGHLFDARRGLPADGHLSASAVAERGVDSDTLSTVAFLVGPGSFTGFPGALDSHFIG